MESLLIEPLRSTRKCLSYKIATIIGLLTCVSLIFVIMACFSTRKKDFRYNTAIYLTPEQIHLSLGSSPNEYVVTWLTFDKTALSMVKFGLKNTGERVENGTMTEFTDGGRLKLKRYVHRVKLSGLQSNSSYIYRCGSIDSWSNPFSFKTMPIGTNWTAKLIIMGDFGQVQAKTLTMIQDDVEFWQPNAIFQLGDFAYNLDSDNGRLGDAWFNDIETFAGQCPFQVCVGNHEFNYNFSNYDNRFSMYSHGNDEKNNWYWSQNIGNVHVIAFSSEFHHFPKYFGKEHIMQQYSWLKEDLKMANKPKNRAKWPWIVTMAHRPMYTQNYIDDKIRIGTNEAPGFEKLFYENGVDICFGGHDHLYERSFPVYDKNVLNGSSAHPYTNPRAPVHITSGAAGCLIIKPKVNQSRDDYSAFVNVDYSYTRMYALNATHLLIDQISQEMDGNSIDTFYLIKDNHGPYN